MIFRHTGLEAVLPDGSRLKNWSVANFAGLHNSHDMKVETILYRSLTFNIIDKMR